MADVVSNIGIGKSISGRGPDYSSTALRAYATTERYKRKETPEKLINLDDFKLGTDNLYPVYAKQVGEVVKKAANDYVEIKNRVGDPVKARNIWEANKAQYQEQINPLLSANSTLKKVSQTEGILFPNREKIMAAANNMETTSEQWASLADMNNGLITTPQYGFDLPPIKEVNLSQIPDKYKTLTEERLGKVQYIPDVATGNRRAWQETITAPTADAIDKTADDILNDVDALQTFRYKYGDVIEKKYPDAKLINSSDPNEQHRATDALRAAAREWAAGKFGTQSRLHPYADNPPRETQADKNKEWKVEGNTYRDGDNIWQYNADSSGKEVFTFVKKDATQNKEMEFKGGKSGGETVEGVPLRFEIPKDGKAVLIVAHKNKIPLKNADGTTQEDANGNEKYTTETTEISVPYIPENADKIKAEFGKNPYEVRSAVTGTLERGTNKTGTIREKTVSSTKKSSGGDQTNESNLVARKTKDGRIGLFNSETKQFVKWE